MDDANSHIGESVLSNLAFQLVTYFHQPTHLRKTKTCEIFARYFVTPDLTALCADGSHQCVSCAKNNQAPKETAPPVIQFKGVAPFEHLEVDFSEVKPCRGYKYVLVMECTFIA